jgi:hypothetical protein
MNPDAPARYPAPVASRAPIWHSAVIFGISFAFLFVTMGLGVNVYDEGLIVFGAMRVMNGDVPYRDFYANYGPRNSTCWLVCLRCSVRPFSSAAFGTLLFVPHCDACLCSFCAHGKPADGHDCRYCICTLAVGIWRLRLSSLSLPADDDVERLLCPAGILPGSRPRAFVDRRWLHRGSSPVSVPTWGRLPPFRTSRR